MQKLNLMIEMHDPVGTIFSELKDTSHKKGSIAFTYAFIMAKYGDDAPYGEINAAIRQRWIGKRALEEVKNEAWKIYARWLNSSGNAGTTPEAQD